jgi:hypothetical protein
VIRVASLIIEKVSIQVNSSLEPKMIHEPMYCVRGKQHGEVYDSYLFEVLNSDQVPER